jgi:hypothetical protein
MGKTTVEELDGSRICVGVHCGLTRSSKRAVRESQCQGF